MVKCFWCPMKQLRTASNSYIFAFTCESIDRMGANSKFGNVYLSLSTRLSNDLPLLSITGCHLFNGETILAKHHQSVVELTIRELLRPGAQREATLGNFVKLRGN
ncbi:Hypothetical protein PHPALM_5705, partial [Phytophthora palmivora]